MQRWPAAMLKDLGVLAASVLKGSAPPSDQKT
jgi:hypothetical protein